MSEYVAELHEDLRKMLDRLSWMRFDPTLHVAEYFAELRKQIDLDAESLISKYNSSRSVEDSAEIVSDVNTTRTEFLRILKKLESRTCLQLKPDVVDSSEAFASLEKRVEQFADSLDDLEYSYAQLGREIIAETDRLEKRILGEQTIIYWPQYEAYELGSLVYFNELYLSKTQIESIKRRSWWFSRSKVLERLQATIRKNFCLSKASLVLKQLREFFTSNCIQPSKFYYVGAFDEALSDLDCSVTEGSNLEEMFISYHVDQGSSCLEIYGDVYLDTSANLHVYSSTRCGLVIKSIRLESLHINLLPSSTDRLMTLNIERVHFESFDPNILAKCTNIKYFILKVTFSKEVKFGLKFLRAFTKLKTLKLTLPDSTCDFSVFKALPSLSTLELTSSSVAYAQPFRKLTREALKQILMSTTLRELALSYFDIEAIDREMFSKCKAVVTLDASRNRIGRIDEAAFVHLGSAYFWRSKFAMDHSELTDWNWNAFGDQSGILSLSMKDAGICTLDATNFQGLVNLNELCLSSNSISELPSGVFGFLGSLHELDLSDNFIRQIKVGSFDNLSQLKKLNMSGNPIETIEANAFSPLVLLKELSLDRCKLASMDSEILNGLKTLGELKLDNNVIERIELLAEDGRRINVTKAPLNDEEKDLTRQLLFKDLSRLSKLHLKGNKLAKLDLSCFVNLTALCDLDLSSNRISELRGQTSILPTLHFLNLSDNYLETIAMKDLPASLKSLRLAGNMLEENQLEKNFPRKFLYEIRDRRNNQMHVRTTKITKLTTQDIKLGKSTALDCSTRLDLSGHLIETLDDISVFTGYSCIDTLNLSDNRLTSIHRNIFNHFLNLSKIDLSKNNLSSVDFGLCQGLDKLSEINLSSNNISFFNLARLFEMIPSLKSLNLADNQLDDRSTAERIDARSSYKLEKLNLGGNRLEKMDFVRDMTNLKSLDLRGNRIESLVSDGYNTLARLHDLCHLDLSGNRIRSLRDEMFAHLRGQLEHLDLSGNPVDIHLDSVLIEII